jgi:hypothetical protein
MTTGRINQVTILSRSPREAPANRPQSGRQSSVRGGSPESDPRCRSPEPELQQVPTARSNCPHCVPQGLVRGARRLRRVSHATLRRRLLSAGHARSGYRPKLAPKCLAENGGHRPVIHRLLRYWRLSPPDFRTPSAIPRPSQAGVSNLGCCASLGPTVTARSLISRPARRRWRIN